jgi:membrane protein DedA with SNARE-associated domain
MTELLASYGAWLVAAFVALETIGAPLPAEAALIAAGVFAATEPGLDIRLLIAASILAALAGNVLGYWIGRRWGGALLATYGPRVGLTAQRIAIGQWLFDRYGGRFVFIARFLPFLRNMAAVLAGTNAMPPLRYYLASGTAAVLWVTAYALASYHIGAAIVRYASPVAASLGLVAVLIILAVPVLILRWERRLLQRIAREEAAIGGP